MLNISARIFLILLPVLMMGVGEQAKPLAQKSMFFKHVSIQFLVDSTPSKRRFLVSKEVSHCIDQRCKRSNYRF